MPQTLTTRLRVLLSSVLEGTVGLASVPATVSRTDTINLASGVGANQADRIYSETRTLAASASTELDLAGVLTDAFGAVLTFARVKAILVVAVAANVNNVLMGGAAATQFVGPLGSVTDVVNIRPGGLALFVAPDATGWVVGAGTADKLKLANGGAGTGVTFDLVIIGTSA